MKNAGFKINLFETPLGSTLKVILQDVFYLLDPDLGIGDGASAFVLDGRDVVEFAYEPKRNDLEISIFFQFRIVLISISPKDVKRSLRAVSKCR